MIRRPARATRTDTLLPDATLVRSPPGRGDDRDDRRVSGQLLRRAHDQGEILRGPARPVLLCDGKVRVRGSAVRSEEHTSELQSLMRTSYAVFCSKQTNITYLKTHNQSVEQQATP